MKKRSILAVMSLATGAFIAAVSPPPAAQADALDGALGASDGVSRADDLTTGIGGEVTDAVERTVADRN